MVTVAVVIDEVWAEVSVDAKASSVLKATPFVQTITFFIVRRAQFQLNL